ncbi:tRNA threonylcarbamoyladenosine dehydratase [Arundinibacter roseus]|uniref:tRNA threonylcarbamoyladenosine dehydratase n=1 Tax=Arundinibacter roseus TaxID=2070510 RepID=A0A4V2X948_9BACT|nr:tRNA threonylcarbamoyladenosine dehydratase [Arundinibacter roseus]TDB62355.1 tRNA threonylcarbamoyladenosine dehydratase [Arundinibacter roseus]
MQDLTWLSRTQLLVGENGISQLQAAHVLIVGLGGVGSFAAEFLVRAGVGTLTIVDGDVVDPTNRNRQLPALATTHGQLKATLMTERLLAINPELNLTTISEFLTPDKIEEVLSLASYTYVMDCIDSVTPKLILLASAYKKGLPIVSSMGAGGKMDPTCLKVSDLFDTYQCGFAYYIRKRLRRLGVDRGIRAVFSTEEVQEDSLIMTDGSNFKRSAYGTISYIPAAFGGVCASVVLRELLQRPVALAQNPLINSKKETKRRNKIQPDEMKEIW